MTKYSSEAAPASAGDGAPAICRFVELEPLLVSAEMRAAGAAVIAELSGVAFAEGLAKRVYIAMANAPIPGSRVESVFLFCLFYEQVQAGSPILDESGLRLGQPLAPTQEAFSLMPERLCG